MAQTIPDMIVTNTWQSVNATTGITLGTQMLLANKTNTHIVVAEGTQPISTSYDGYPLETRGKFGGNIIIDPDSLEIWVRVAEGKGTGLISVQEDA